MKFTINNQILSEKELYNLCEQKLLSTCEDWEKVIYNFILSWLNNSSSILVETSGSTGKPKKIWLKKEKMVQSALLTKKYLSLQIGQSALLCLPVKYIAGKMMIVRAFVCKLHLITVKPNTQPLETINKSIDFTAMTPYQVYHSFGKIEKIKNLIIGGAPIPYHLQNRLAKVKTNIYHSYGMTETISHVALKKISGQKPQTYFNGLPNITFSKDSRKCLIIQAPSFFKEKIITNDIVKLRNKKQFEWVGRFDFVINSGGIKIIPEEIEKIIAPYLKNHFFLTAKKDPILEEKIVLLIEGKVERKTILIKNLKKVIKNKFSSYYIPKEILFFPKFFYTETEKIDRKKTASLLKEKKVKNLIIN